MFRDGVIEDALNLQGKKDKVSVWAYLPNENGQNMARLQTLALIRRFMSSCAKEFPGGLVLKADGFRVTPTFIAFIRTHREMGTPHAEVVMAWKTMQEILDEPK